MSILRSMALGLALALLLGASPVQAQTSKDVEGTWQLVSVTVMAGEKKTDLFGADPKGQLVLGADGRFTIVVTRSDLPKYKSGARAKGTADEYQATVQGTNAYFGTYTVDNGALVLKVAGSTFPNSVGETQTRPVKVAGDEMTYTTPATKGGAVTTLTWKRAK
jgi:Lipocalin-like domain